MIFVSSKISDGNMDFRFGNAKEVSKNRSKFFKTYGINTVFEITQTHGNKDMLITNDKDAFLMLKTADCIAIGFYDPKNQAVALAHAGWRGLEKGIIKNAVTKMQKKFQTNPKDLKVNLGPSIGPCCYRLNLWKQAENQLENLGVFKKNIDNPKICTYHTNDYFSHRKSEDQKTPDARFVTILGLQNVN